MVRRLPLVAWLLLFVAPASTVNADDPDYAKILDECEGGSMSVEDCEDLIAQSLGNAGSENVQVLVVHPRIIEDKFYNQVVIPVDFRGFVLGGEPSFNNMIYYPFEWRGTGELGTRKIGPFDCTHKTGVQCCNTILDEVADEDINGKYVDCWLAESFQESSEGELVEVYRNFRRNTVHELTDRKIKNYEEGEAKRRESLILEISSLIVGATGTEAVQNKHMPRKKYVRLCNRVRRALRGYPQSQGVPYLMTMQLRSTPSSRFIHIAENEELQEQVFPKIIQCLQELTAERGMHRLGGFVEGVGQDVIVLQEQIDEHTNTVLDVVDKTSFLDLTEDP
jgi:hypothetical protein